MGTKKTETKQSTSTGPRGQQEEQLLQLMQMLSSRAGNQIQLGEMAAGSAPIASQELRDLVAGIVNPQADIERAGVEQAYARSSDALGGQLESSGLGDSTIEAVRQAVLGGQKAGALENVESRRSGKASEMTLNSAFQNRQSQLGANQLLVQMLMGLTGTSNMNMLNTRLSNTKSTGTQEQSGFAAGDLAALAQFGATT